ncbi:MAG TPA: hypothetical protein VJV04_06380 [Nitrospiraceae bacterium]|nr:hypothetical protein [Nitrospiraceae bacterium]
MKPLLFRPPLFLLTGFAWLMLSSLVGIFLFLSMTRSIPLQPMLRLLHVHGALIGGVAQMILGAMLAFIPPLLMSGRDRPESHPVLFAFMNVGTIGILVGFWLQHYTVVGVSGLLVLVAFLSLLTDAIRQSRSSLMSPPLNLWFYGIALVAVLAGLGMGLAMAFRVLPVAFLGQGRLAHIHLNLLGFVTLTIIGTMHNLLPTVLNTRLHSGRLARITFFILPLAVVLLVTGFLLSNLWVQIGAGVILLAGVLLYSYNILRTWMEAGRPSNIASDHFLLATLFLVLTVATGILVSANFLWDPPGVPFGRLHLVAYTHLALIGFVLQTIVGALSHLLPISLAVGRVPSNKKRGPYLATLTAIAGRWRIVQVATLTFGTIGLALVAALVWQYSLGSAIVQIASWTTAAFLFIGLSVFGAKIGLLLAQRPPT